MSDDDRDVSKSSSARPRSKPWFFIAIVAGILVGSILDDAGAGVAIGIALWMILGLREKASRPGTQDGPQSEDDRDLDR